MKVTFVNLKNETIGEAYCLREWVEEVRMERDNINRDDLGRLVWRTIDTLKIYPPT